MNGFTYHDIFETKGIEYLAIIAFFLILIPFWLLLNKRGRIAQQFRKGLARLSLNTARIPQGVYHGKNHTWAFLEKAGTAKVGIDNLLTDVLGDITFNALKHPGDRITKGDLLTELEQNGKSLKIFSPISGTVTAVNPLLTEPGTVGEDPYGNGWICRIKPAAWIEETKSLYLAEHTVEWSKSELERLKDFFAGSARKYADEPTLMVLQDGGEIMQHTMSEMPAGVWQDFQENFLEKVE